MIENKIESYLTEARIGSLETEERIAIKKMVKSLSDEISDSVLDMLDNAVSDAGMDITIDENKYDKAMDYALYCFIEQLVKENSLPVLFSFRGR